MDSFQPDFYAACATIIPVLLLAIAVQTTSYQDLLNMLAKAARGTPRNARLLRKVWAVIAMELAFFVGVLLVGTGLWGEIAALSTLYVGSELGQRGPVLVTTVILFFAASAGPLQSALAATIAGIGWAPADPSLDHQSVGDEKQADIPEDD